MQNLKREPIKTAHSVPRDKLHFGTFYRGQQSALTRLDQLAAISGGTKLDLGRKQQEVGIAKDKALNGKSHKRADNR